ncbi:MAG TPA: hypothetical protein DCF49_10505 [Lachnospiraceae bacterium]|nr:hypothetical protein [Lachnospiraceae bacterium]
MNPKKAMVFALLVLLAVISATRIAPMAADPANHSHSIEKTEEKISSVMKLSGGAAATSATLSLLPGDVCTPIAGQLAELAKYFLLVLSSLYLEKFLISLSGYITFGFLLPVACILLGVTVLTGKRNLSRTAGKIALVGIVIFLIVPASVWLSDMVYQTQAEKVNETIEEYNDLSIEGEEDGGIFSEITSITSETIDRVTSFIDNLLESLAVMIVTACVIPILVFVFLIWLVKTIFSENVLTLDASVVEAISEKLK